MLPIMLDLPTLTQFYERGGTPMQMVEAVIARRDAWPDKAVFISPTSDDELRLAARRLMDSHPQPGSLPLWGVPFAVKDNIDVEAFPRLPGARLLHMSRRGMLRWLRALGQRAPLSSARPISTSSRRG